jgi:hypothetical protein
MPRCWSTPEAATATGLLLRAERGSLIETAAWATNGQSAQSLGFRAERERRRRRGEARSNMKAGPSRPSLSTSGETLTKEPVKLGETLRVRI